MRTIYTNKHTHTRAAHGRGAARPPPGSRTAGLGSPSQPAEGTPSPSCIPATDPSADSHQDVLLLLPNLLRSPGGPHRGREHRAGRRRGTRPDRHSQAGEGRTGRERKGVEGRERGQGRAYPDRDTHPRLTRAPPSRPAPRPRARGGARTAAGRGHNSAERAAPSFRR